MSTFFDDQPLDDAALPSKEELHARVFPPEGFDGALVVEAGQYLVWRMPADLADSDRVVFFDGDCRDVLMPDDPRLAA